MDEMNKRSIILYTNDPYNVNLKYSITCYPNNSGHGYYIDEILKLNELNQDYIVEHVDRVYFELLKDEIPSIHHTFCRELAFSMKAEIFFIYNGLEIRVAEDTPDDWWDMSIEDALQLHKDDPEGITHVGPYYVNLSGELLKKSLWLCTTRVNEINDVINRGIQYDYPDLCHTWRDEFDSYMEYRSWNTERLTEEFIMRRRIKRYCDLLRDQRDTFTKADADRYEAEFEAKVEETKKKKRRGRKKKADIAE